MLPFSSHEIFEVVVRDGVLVHVKAEDFQQHGTRVGLAAGFEVGLRNHLDVLNHIGIGNRLPAVGGRRDRLLNRRRGRLGCVLAHFLHNDKGGRKQHNHKACHHHNDKNPVLGLLFSLLLGHIPSAFYRLLWFCRRRGSRQAEQQRRSTVRSWFSSLCKFFLIL